jgi:hypothetical protein
LERLGQRVQSPTLDLDEAFDIAIQIETSKIEDIRERLTQVIHGPAYVLRKREDLALPNHYVKLRGAAERFDVSPDIRSRLSRLP